MWREALEATSFKKELFLSPETTRPTGSATDSKDASDIYITHISSDFSSQEGGLASRPPPKIITVHPLLQCYVDETKPRDVEMGFFVRDLLKYETIGRWSEAFISQPPVCEMEFRYGAWGSEFTHDLTLRDGGGLRLRHVQKAIQDALDMLLEDSDAVQGATSQTSELSEYARLPGYDAYLWGESPPGTAVLTIKNCIADLSNWDPLDWAKAVFAGTPIVDEK